MIRNGEHTGRACVIGAGIGGLAAAVSLSARGWDVTVLERGTARRDGGAGLGITPNGLRALEYLGAGDTVRRRSVEQIEGGIRRANGRWIARTELEFVRRRYGTGVRALHRFELIRSLEERLPPGAVWYGTDVVRVSAGGASAPATVLTSRGDLSFALVIAADGARSRIRRLLFSDHPGLRHAGCSSWRLVAHSHSSAIAAAETWGVGARFAILPLGSGAVHCSALVASSQGRYAGTDHERELLARFGQWHSPIPELLQSRRAAPIFHDEIEELVAPLPNFVVGRIALVGDAAHAMTPNVGSANLALEDAVVLGHAVGPTVQWPELRRGLSGYSAARRRRTAVLARLSRRIGRVALWSSPGAVAIRDLGVRAGGLLPPTVTARSLDTMLDWWPPEADRSPPP